MWYMDTGMLYVKHWISSKLENCKIHNSYALYY